jgi:hypothetical protein
MADAQKLQKFADFRNEKVLQNYQVLRKEKETLEQKLND